MSGETRFEDTIICPKCGNREDEPYEFFRNGRECAEMECSDCGVSLSVSQHVDVKYSARVKEEVMPSPTSLNSTPQNVSRESVRQVI